MPRIEVQDGYAWCGRCNQALEKSNFHSNKNSYSGCDGYCKQCRKKHYLSNSSCSRHITPQEDKTFCCRCKVLKGNSEFAPFRLKLLPTGKRRGSACCRACAYLEDISEAPPKRKMNHSDKHQAFKDEVPFEISNDPVKLAYAAGLFDAEGTATLSSSRSSCPRLAVSNNNAVILESFKEIAGGSIDYLDRKNGDRSAIISQGTLLISRLAAVRTTAAALIPFLVLKRERCELLIKASFQCPQDRRIMRPVIRGLNKKGITENPILPKSRHVSSDEVTKTSDKYFAYLAGMTDGDGWIGFRYGKPQIQISLSKISVLLWIHSVFGGAIIVSKVKGKRATKFTWRPLWDRQAWRVSIPRLLEFLTLKKRHAELSLKAMDLDEGGQHEIILEQRRLTALSRLEKFQRVKNQLPEFEKRLIRDENGIIIGIRDEVLGDVEFEPEIINDEGEEF